MNNLSKKAGIGIVLGVIVLTLSFSVFSFINRIAYDPSSGHIGIDPVSGEVAVGESFTTSVKVEVPAGKEATNAGFELTYPAEGLETVTARSLLPENWEEGFTVIDTSQAGVIVFSAFTLLGDPLLAGDHRIAEVTFRVRDGTQGEQVIRLRTAEFMTAANENLVDQGIDTPAVFTVAAARCVDANNQPLAERNTCFPGRPPLFCDANLNQVSKSSECGCPINEVPQRDGTCRPAVQHTCDLLVRQNLKLESNIGSADNGCPDNGVTITADNVVLDCDGYTIHGSGLHNGIHINRRNNVQVKNCRVVNFNRGIAVEQSSQVTIRNTEVKNNNDFGIHLRGSSLNTIIQSNVTGNKQGMMLDAGSDRNTLGENLIADNQFNGLTVQSSLGNTLRGNTVRNNLFGIFLRLANSNTVEDNIIEKNKRHGIDVVLADSNTFESNVIQDNDADNDEIGDGIRLLSSRFNTLVDNRVMNTRGGAFGNRVGIHLEQGSTDNRLEDNVVNRNKVNGIFIEDSNNNVVQHTVACDNEGRDFACDDQSTRITGRENTFGDAQLDDNGAPVKVAACSDGFPQKNTNYQFCFLQAEDADEDGVRDEEDNCPAQYCLDNGLDVPQFCANPLQRDPDRDTIGDPCDGDNDNDGLQDNTEPVACQQTANGLQKKEQRLIQQGLCDLTGEICTGCLVGDFSGRAGLGPDAPDGCVNAQDISYVTANAGGLLDRLTIRGFTQLLFALHANYNQQCVPPRVS